MNYSINRCHRRRLRHTTVQALECRSLTTAAQYQLSGRQQASAAASAEIVWTVLRKKSRFNEWRKDPRVRTAYQTSSFRELWVLVALEGSILV